ncbi:TonB-dependent SusC/RagA subfamily outer membrane receptor [Dysgonomonas sp. PH5-45]|uniref:carboxypeptidase-like regulatory domain-containing protein n=1 Tax=unclassified Dysgonomonas TaxID=2630389 RepID=UPI00247585B9|nr:MULTISPECIES: carboxypeptidase-like regulatory domain-containing protein [unclassified Dysgonomonas]MDH6354351.1 TonB-dependent SusC/RagA subfamily outer membrane receptor [Dysgonomonas sp. PH5-45]MDH6387251.1 TonB-dependent SusC/RagA subfamily outer membrane receptor [Dysgonomonas sp. PH5-37]
MKTSRIFRMLVLFVVLLSVTSISAQTSEKHNKSDFYTCKQQNAQKIVVSGTVTSTGDDEPLIGAIILAKGSKSGTATDLEGQYTIVVYECDTLVVSYVNYKQKTVSTPQKSETLNIALEPNETAIDDIVINRYNSRKETDTLVGFVKKIDSDKMQDKTGANMTDVHQDSVAGLKVYNPNDIPTSTFRLHDGGMLVALNTPLYIIDGKFVSGNITTINQEVESISVLKNSLATSLYGKRAAKGVVIIVTKDAKSKKKTNTPTPVIGTKKYRKYLKIAHKETCDGKRGKVILEFTVATDGTPENIQVIKSLCPTADNEAIRLLQKGVKWRHAAGKARIEVTF